MYVISCSFFFLCVTPCRNELCSFWSFVLYLSYSVLEWIILKRARKILLHYHGSNKYCYNFSTRGRVDDSSFFDYLSTFCFLLIEYSFYFLNILSNTTILYLLLLFWLRCDRPSGLHFFRVRFASFRAHSSLLAFFLCFFIFFHSCCSRARVFGKTLVHEFPISYSHTEWYLFFFRQRNYSCTMCIRIEKLEIVMH